MTMGAGCGHFKPHGAQLATDVVRLEVIGSPTRSRSGASPMISARSRPLQDPSVTNRVDKQAGPESQTGNQA
jgi:hypothetical protein